MEGEDRRTRGHHQIGTIARLPRSYVQLGLGGFPPRHVLDASIPRDLSIELLAADGTDHCADGRLRVVGPEQSHVFPGLEVETHLVAIHLAKCLAVLEERR